MKYNLYHIQNLIRTKPLDCKENKAIFLCILPMCSSPLHSYLPARAFPGARLMKKIVVTSLAEHFMNTKEQGFHSSHDPAR